MQTLFGGALPQGAGGPDKLHQVSEFTYIGLRCLGGASKRARWSCKEMQQCCALCPADMDRPCRCGSANYCTHRCMKDDKDAHVHSGECSLLQADSAR